jgi:hypothetical protein
MSHLSLETIGRLVDEAPQPDEKAHLEACAACRTELEDMRADLARLQSLPAIEPPPGEWQAIEARLDAEGLIRRPGLRLSWRASALRAAAAIAIFLLGTLSGVAWVGGRSQPLLTAMPGDILPAARPSASAPAMSRPGVQNGARQAALGQSPVRVDNPLAAALLQGRMPDTREDAARFLGEAEMLYMDALRRMAELGAGSEPGDPYARLAALEGIAAITRAALGQSPADPVLNGYHITALAQREATLRQIAASGPSWF